MFRRSTARTGIDLGTAGVKLVRVEGRGPKERVTHVGVEPPGDGPDDPADRTAQALKRLLKRLELRRSGLGHVAVSLAGPDVRLREAVLPPMSEKELRRALPYEARKHLDVDDLDSPVLDAQILGQVTPEDTSLPPQTRVLFAATPTSHRGLLLAVLAAAGIEPAVIDAEPLAALTAIASSANGAATGSEPAFAVLDVGAGRAQLHMTGSDGTGLLTRQLGGGVGVGSSDDPAALARSLAARVGETFTFYRARYRRDPARLLVAGGAAASKPFMSALEHHWAGPLAIFDPLGPSAARARGITDAAEQAPRFMTARGLCTRLAHDV